MGIFGAMTTAIAGLRAQSFALGHVSDNIANSQTIGFKRTETVFQDLVTESNPTMQPGGSVIALSRATNTIAGEIQQSSVPTHMSISGDGYFIVEQKASEADGNPVFLGVDRYTRRGDFTLDKSGQLVNSAGYYLKGIPIDPTTGNPSGGALQVIKIDGGMVPARATNAIDYEANLPGYPKTAASNATVPGSELLDGSGFANNPVTALPASAVGTGASIAADAAAALTGTADLSALAATGGDLVLNGTTVAIPAAATGSQAVTTINGATSTTGVSAALDGSGRLVLTSADADTNVDIGAGSDATTLTELGLAVGTTNATNLITQGAVTAGQTLTVQLGSGAAQTVTFGNGAGQVSTFAELQAALAAISNVNASIDSSGNISLTAPDVTSGVTVGGSATVANFGLAAGTTSPTAGVGTVLANEADQFIEQTIAGGAITAYDPAGSPVDVQFRWGKIADGTWNLFYQTNSAATGSQVAWRNVGQNYVFDAAGKLSPAVNSIDIANLTVDGNNLGTIRLDHGSNQITQFADPNGAANVTVLDQNGYASGQLESVAVSDSGRIVGNYTNGKTIDLFDVTLASFNADSMLSKLDGGAFAETAESGPAIIGAQGKIIASTLEGSNADIADEFSKLIVTQQAYAAGTRIVTSADQMMQEALNMKR